MESLLLSTVTVAVAEIGDKTQLLSLLLVARYRQPRIILLGILLATLANHAVAAWIGQEIAAWLEPELLSYLLGGSFLAMALWVLRPDGMDANVAGRRYGGVLGTTLLLFFLAEIGDKTQVATIALGARYQAVVAVVLGSTLGMLIANAPVVLGGRYILARLPLTRTRRIAAALFAGIGVLTLLEAGL